MRWLLMVLFVSGCTHAISLRVLEPADVMLPAEVQRLGVIDRHKPATRGQALLDVLEGIATGEAVNMDREGARAAVRGVADRVQQSPRFEAVVPVLDRRDLPTGMFGRPLSLDEVREICRRTGTDALVSLDSFDTDAAIAFSTRTEIETDRRGREIAVLIHDAQLDLTVTSGWRVYHPESGVVDALREVRRGDAWVGSGRTPALARAALATAWQGSSDAGFRAGKAYGARVVPTWVRVERVYYGGGDPRLRSARRHVKASDWKGAKTIWERMANDPRRKRRGKALLGVALAHEVAGDLDRAHATAKKAAVALSNGRSRLYVRQLKRRIDDRARLRQQMEAPAPKPSPRTDERLAVPDPQPSPPARPRPRPAPAPAPAQRPPTRVERPR